MDFVLERLSVCAADPALEQCDGWPAVELQGSYAIPEVSLIVSFMYVIKERRT
jgi:hypothetical protein